MVAATAFLEVSLAFGFFSVSDEAKKAITGAFSATLNERMDGTLVTELLPSVIMPKVSFGNSSGFFFLIPELRER